MSTAKALVVVAGGLLAVAAAGFFLARAWYQDDACIGEEWKCDLGNVGLALVFYAGIPGVLVAVAALVAALVARRSVS